MADVSIFGPVDALLAAEVGVGEVVVVEAIVFLLVLANLVTRKVAHDRHVRRADDGAEAVDRVVTHELTTVLLVLFSFYYLTVDAHAGMVMSVLALGLFLTDFFEFEARQVEARREVPIERPKGAIVASLLVLSYAGYQVFFFLLEGPISSVV